ncbi:hypothetical protein KAJ27_02145 [bacterium]|nr:hypothetical protein [bacterium]
MEFPPEISVLARQIEYDNKILPMIENNFIEEFRGKKNRSKIPIFSEGNKINIVLGKTLKNNQKIILKNIRFRTASKSMKASEVKLYPLGEEEKLIYSKEKIKIGLVKAKFSNSGRINIVANTGDTPIPDFNIRFSSKSTLVQRGDYLRIAFPDDYPIAWSKNLNNVKIEGNASSCFQSGVQRYSDKVIIFKVDDIPKEQEYIKLTNLRAYVDVNVNADITDSVENKRSFKRSGGVTKLSVGTRDGFLSQHLVESRINISFIDLSLIKDQTFFLNGKTNKTKSIKITIKSPEPVYRAGDELILALPDVFGAKFDMTMNRIQVTGPSAEKISDRVTTNAKQIRIKFIHDLDQDIEEFIIDGVRLTNFKKISSTFLELRTGDNSKTICRSTEKWYIDEPLFQSLEDQLVFEGEENTQLFSVSFQTRNCIDLFDAGKSIYVKLPENIQIAFHENNRFLQLGEEERKYFNPMVSYPNDKLMKIDIISSIPVKKRLLLSGIMLGVPQGLTALPDTLLFSVDNKYHYIKDEASIQIIPENDEFNRGLYVCNFIKNNFKKNDIISISLVSDDDSYELNWDMKRNDIEIGGYSDIIRILDISRKKIKIEIMQDWDLHHFIILNNLKVSSLPDKKGAAYLQLEWDNLFGPNKNRFFTPIALSSRLSRNPSPGGFNSRIQAFLDMKRNNYSNLQSIDRSGEKLLPPIELKPGYAEPGHKRRYETFITHKKNIQIAVEQNLLERADGWANELIRIGPNSWYGYYFKSRVLKEKDEELGMAQQRFEEAKARGYIPSSVYPPVFQGTPDEQMIINITDAITLINENDLVRAEKKLLTYESMIDSLSDKVIAQANYWLCFISYRFKDLRYIELYGNLAYDHGYQSGMSWEEISIDMMYGKTKGLTYLPPGNIELYPPQGLKGDNLVHLQFINTQKIPYPIDIINRSKGNERYKKKFFETISIDEQEIYQVKVKPVQYQAKKSLMTFTGMGLLWLLLIL